MALAYAAGGLERVEWHPLKIWLQRFAHHEVFRSLHSEQPAVQREAASRRPAFQSKSGFPSPTARRMLHVLLATRSRRVHLHSQSKDGFCSHPATALRLHSASTPSSLLAESDGERSSAGGWIKQRIQRCFVLGLKAWRHRITLDTRRSMRAAHVW